MLSRIETSDILIVAGLILLGLGLFLWLGRGIALTIEGALILILGIAANVAENRVRTHK